MGVITLTLIAAGVSTSTRIRRSGSSPRAPSRSPPAPTRAAGGIIKTLGKGPHRGRARAGVRRRVVDHGDHPRVELASASPLSTTQVASGSVIGTGLGRKGAKVKWGTAGKIAIGWLITIPASAPSPAHAALLANQGMGHRPRRRALLAAAIAGIYPGRGAARSPTARSTSPSPAIS